MSNLVQSNKLTRNKTVLTPAKLAAYSTFQVLSLTKSAGVGLRTTVGAN